MQRLVRPDFEGAGTMKGLVEPDFDGDQHPDASAWPWEARVLIFVPSAQPPLSAHRDIQRCYWGEEDTGFARVICHWQ